MTETLEVNSARQDARYPIRGMTVQCIRSEGADNHDEEVIEGEVLDLSPGGVKLLVSTSVRISESLGLQITIPELDLEIDVTAAVCWTRPADDQSWHLGCSFLPNLSDEVLDELATGGFVERRDKPRRPLNVNGMLSWQLTDEAMPVQICDVSSGGFNLTIDQPPPVAQIVMLQLQDAIETEVSIVADVQWTLQRDGHHLVGCAYKDRTDHKIFRELMPKDSGVLEDEPSSAAAGARKWFVAAALLLVGVGLVATALLFASNGDTQGTDNAPEVSAPVSDSTHEKMSLESTLAPEEPQVATAESAPVQDDLQPATDHQTPAADQPATAAAKSGAADEHITDTTKQQSVSPAIGSHETATADDVIDSPDANNSDSSDNAGSTEPAASEPVAADEEPKVVETEADKVTEEQAGTPDGDSLAPTKMADQATETKEQLDIATEQGNVTGSVAAAEQQPDDEVSPAESDAKPAAPIGKEKQSSQPVNQVKAGYSYMMADRLYRQRRYADAAAAFETAVRFDSDNPLYHYLLAMVQYQMNDIEEATQTLDKATRLERKRPIKNWGQALSRYQGSVRLWVENGRAKKKH